MVYSSRRRYAPKPKRRTYGSFKARPRGVYTPSKKVYAKPKSNLAYVKKVAKEAAKEALGGPSKTIVAMSHQGQVPFFHDPDNHGYNYFGMPITAMVPIQRGANAPPDDRWRTSNKVKITGVDVQLSILHEGPVRVMALIFPAKAWKGSVKLIPGPNGIAKEFALMGDSKIPRLLSVVETGLDNTKEGPFDVSVTRFNGTETISLDSVTGSFFGIPLSKGSGAPIGKCTWGGSKIEYRTYVQEFPGGTSASGASIMATHKPQVFFTLDKVVEFNGPGENHQVSAPDLMVLL